MTTQPQDPVRQAHADALARRAAQHTGTARQLMDARLQQLRAALHAVPAQGRPVVEAAAAPLTRLLAYITQHTAAPGELKAVRDYRGTWQRLGVEQRLTQTLQKVPDNAGPLNTQRLLHQALTLMRSASPAYLQHFMAHAEALLALEQLGQSAQQGQKGPAGSAAPASKKTGSRSSRAS